MKRTRTTYADYIAEYTHLMCTSQDRYIVRPEIWISNQWQEDNDFDPNDDDSLAKLDALAATDPKLHRIVQRGLEAMLQAMLDAFFSQE